MKQPTPKAARKSEWKAAWKSAFSDTGGIRYHVRGLHRADTQWAKFRDQVSEWITQWIDKLPNQESLIVVGPSAGYSIRPGTLNRFKTIWAVEPDPLARVLFERRQGLRPRWVKEHLLSPDLQAWKCFLEEHPGAPVLFTNVLGQLYLRPEFSRAHQAHDGLSLEWCRELVQSLEGRAWATYHDRLSGPIAPRELALKALNAKCAWISNQDFLIQHYPKIARDRMEQLGLADHRTEQLGTEPLRSSLSQATFCYWVWPISPENLHLIEAIALPAP